MQGFETVLKVTGSTGVNVARHAGPSPATHASHLESTPSLPHYVKIRVLALQG